MVVRQIHLKLQESRDENCYYAQAVDCVKNSMFPVQSEIFEKSGRDFDVVYGKYMNNDMCFTSQLLKQIWIYVMNFEET